MKSKKFKEKHLVIGFFVFWFVLFLILSIFRNAQRDENIYMGESAVIADLLNNGKWIGNYGVGLHGFITKLIVGIIFIFTGPSVFVATSFNVILGLFSGVVFYNILRKHFNFSLSYSFLGTTLLFCSYQFLTYIPTFYRDIGVLFFLLLTFDSVLSKKSKWIVGVLLVLVLDAKEHVFFTIAPAFIIWTIIENWAKVKRLSNRIWGVILDIMKLFLPACTFLLLMFSTSIIPLNTYNANILGIIDEGLNPLMINFDPQYATVNRDQATNPEDAKVVPKVHVSSSTSGITTILERIINIGLSYIGKISYPRTFSYLSIPFVILIPSLLTCFRYFRSWQKKKEYEKLLIPLTICVYLAFYIFHASISRYILPISPLVLIFFLFFVKDVWKGNSKFLLIFFLTVVFSSLGIMFEYSFVFMKICVTVLILALLFLSYILQKKSEILKILIILIISIFTAGASLLASYKVGQIGSYLLYGYNRECREVVDLVSEGENVWVNDIGWDRLPYVLRSENVQDPEWRWGLQEWVPKKDLLVRNDEFSTYSFRWRKEYELKDIVEERGISQIVYTQLEKTFAYDELYMQDRLSQLSGFSWLELLDTVGLKNKTVYIFEVKGV
ncbi:MAG: hypothetical protein ABIC57_02915 [bacterium]